MILSANEQHIVGWFINVLDGIWVFFNGRKLYVFIRAFNIFDGGPIFSNRRQLHGFCWIFNKLDSSSRSHVWPQAVRLLLGFLCAE